VYEFSWVPTRPLIIAMAVRPDPAPLGELAMMEVADTHDAVAPTVSPIEIVDEGFWIPNSTPLIVIEAPPLSGAESKTICVTTGELNVNISTAVPNRSSTAVKMLICAPEPGIATKQPAEV
jgi:hypothetical protein